LPRINSRRRLPNIAPAEPDPVTRVPHDLQTTAATAAISGPVGLCPSAPDAAAMKQPFALAGLSASFTAACPWLPPCAFVQNSRLGAQGQKPRRRLFVLSRRSHRPPRPRYHLHHPCTIAKCRDVFRGDLPEIVQPCPLHTKGLAISSEDRLEREGLPNSGPSHREQGLRRRTCRRSPKRSMSKAIVKASMSVRSSTDQERPQTPTMRWDSKGKRNARRVRADRAAPAAQTFRQRLALRTRSISEWVRKGGQTVPPSACMILDLCRPCWSRGRTRAQHWSPPIFCIIHD